MSRPTAPEATPAHQLPRDAPDGIDETLDIGRAVATGIKWKAITQVISEGSRVLVALILARLLTPHDYGVAGMAMVCVSFASLFTDPALGTALVQRRRLTEQDRSTVFWTTCAIGVVVALAGVGLSGLVADMFGQREVKPLFMVLSVGLFLSAASVTQLALLTRELAYRSIEIRQIAATLVAAVCAVSVAFAGFGPWAIITNWLVFTAVSLVFVWTLTPWRPTFTFSRDSLTDLGGFGVKVFGARVLTWGSSNMDNVLIGRFLGAAPLGAYALAYNVMYVPITRISVPLLSVLSPAYARMQHDRERLFATWLKSKSMITALLGPAFAVVIVVSPDLVPVAFGSKWHAAVVPIQLLSLAGLAQTVVAPHWSILTALDRPGTLFRVNLLVTAVTIAAFVAGLPFGIVGVAGFYAAARWMLLVLDTAMTTRAVSYPFWQSLHAGLDSLPVAVAAGAAGLGVRLLLVDEGVPQVARLFVVAAVICGSYVLFLYVAMPRMFADLRATIRRRPA